MLLTRPSGICDIYHISPRSRPITYLSFLLPLKTGVTFATFHAAVKVFVDRQRFSSFDSDGDIAGAAILSNLALMPSSPVALWVGVESSNSASLFCVIVRRSNGQCPVCESLSLSG